MAAPTIARKLRVFCPKWPSPAKSAFWEMLDTQSLLIFTLENKYVTYSEVDIRITRKLSLDSGTYTPDVTLPFEGIPSRMKLCNNLVKVVAEFAV